ncbi:MAG: hypothetical protein ACTSU2_11815 [Promethearchaeota archaeon]
MDNKILNNFKELIRGNMSQKVLMTYISLIFGQFVLLLYISWCYYPASMHYSILKDSMSYLGNYLVNPKWYLFSLTIIISSLFAIPIYFLIDSKLKKIKEHPHLSIINKLSFYLATILDVLVGFFPHNQTRDWVCQVHRQLATFSGIFYIISGVIFFIRGINVFKRSYVAVFFWTLMIWLGFMVIFLIIAGIIGLQQPAPFPYSFSVYEWGLIFLYEFLFYSVALKINAEI